MTWKIWRWFRSPPPTVREGDGMAVADREAEDALRRAWEAKDTARSQAVDARELRRRSDAQRQENHFGSDLYQVWRHRRG